MHATIALLVTLLLAACTSGPLPATTATAKQSPILQGLLVDTYTAHYNPATDQLTMKMEWFVRFGQIVETTKLANLNLDKATIEAVPGGAFRDTVHVSIPTNNPYLVKAQSWPASPDFKLSTRPNAPTKSSRLSFHCPTRKQAQATLAELRKLQSR